MTQPTRRPGHPGRVSLLRRGLLAAQRDELTRIHADGEIGEATRRRIQRQLDLEEAGLTALLRCHR